MQTVGLFVDIEDLFCRARRIHNKKVDYLKLKEQVVGDNILYGAWAYGRFKDEKIISFVTALKKMGYTTCFSKQGGCINLCLDVIKSIDKLDLIVIASSNPELIYLVDHLKTLGKEVRVLGIGSGEEITCFL